MVDFAKEIQGIRKALGLNQAEFAEEARVSQGSVSKWERGLEKPKTDAWLRIRRLYESHQGFRTSERFDVYARSGADVAIVSVPFIGALERLSEADVLADSFPRMLTLALPLVDGLSQRIAAWVIPELMGSSVNDMPGGTVVFADIGEGNYEPQDGERVVLQSRTLEDRFGYQLAYFGRSDRGIEWFTPTPVEESRVRLAVTIQTGRRAEKGLRVVGPLVATLRWESSTLDLLRGLTAGDIFDQK